MKGLSKMTTVSMHFAGGHWIRLFPITGPAFVDFVRNNGVVIKVMETDDQLDQQSGYNIYVPVSDEWDFDTHDRVEDDLVTALEGYLKENDVHSRVNVFHKVFEKGNTMEGCALYTIWFSEKSHLLVPFLSDAMNQILKEHRLSV